MTSETAASVLRIDLGAIVDNYGLLCARLSGGAECAAVVKADAYGLGADRIAPALLRAGCKTFFVAHLSEAIALRPVIGDCDLFVLNGLLPGAEANYLHHGLIPVLNTLGEIDAWSAAAKAMNRRLPAALQLDSGMSRLGLPDDELDVVAADHGRLEGIALRCVVSHLACADEPDHPLNSRQLAEFHRKRAKLPRAPASIANSSGIFLGPEYHLDLVRPGIAIYGGNPTPSRPNPMREIVRLEARILQVRVIDSPRSVGYGATHSVNRKSRIATVPVGYADGYLRALSNRAFAYIGRHRVPVVGRVSMDLITLDVSAVPPGESGPGTLITLLGGPVPLDRLANWGGTISYEILTRLGRRFERIYENAELGAELGTGLGE